MALRSGPAGHSLESGMRRRPTIVTLAAATALWAVAASGTPQSGGDGLAGADPDVCAGCHEDQVVTLARTPHALLDRDGLAVMALADSSCAACHGDATAHLSAGGSAGTLFGFRDQDPAGAKVEHCLTCHRVTHPRFRASAHARAGLDCTGCHSIHAATATSRALLASGSREPSGMRILGEVSRSCFGCHGDVFTQFEFNERHRLQEGVLDCTSCHDPHEPPTRSRLAGFIHEPCIRCHSDKGGPFIYEHASSMADGCAACHTPHGSPNRHLLTYQATAELCYSCHALVPGFHSRFTLDTVCTNCHSSIHGSNFDPDFLK